MGVHGFSLIIKIEEVYSIHVLVLDFPEDFPEGVYMTWFFCGLGNSVFYAKICHLSISRLLEKQLKQNLSALVQWHQLWRHQPPNPLRPSIFVWSGLQIETRENSQGCLNHAVYFVLCRYIVTFLGTPGFL